MRNVLLAGACIALLVVGMRVGNASAATSSESGVGVRLGAGTDIGGGIAYGGGINYLYAKDAAGAWEIGLVGYGGSFEETTNDYFTYVEKTDVFAFGVLVNRLVKYSPGMKGPFTVFGLGAGAVSVTWEERSTGDTSLGPRLPGGGSMQSADGTGGGLIVNLGVGYVFGGPADVRLEAPIIFNSSAPGGSSSVIPAITLTAGMRF